jgi:hypothetical protein
MNKIRGRNKKIQSTSHVKKKKEGKKEENKKKEKGKNRVIIISPGSLVA